MLGTLRLHLSRLGARHRATNPDDLLGRANRALNFFTRITRRLVNAERCSVFIVDPESDSVWLKAGTGLEDRAIEVSIDGSVVGQVIRSGEVLFQSHLEEQEGAHQATDVQTGFHTHNVLCVPIRDPGMDEVVGAIQALNKQDGQAFDERDARWLEEVAEQVQAQVSRIYYDQEIYGLSEKVLNSATRIIRFISYGVALLVMLLLVMMFLWLTVPILN